MTTTAPVTNLHDIVTKNCSSLRLHAGLPAPDYKTEDFKAQGGKIVFFLTPEEVASSQLEKREAVVTWRSDQEVRRFLFDNMHLWVGGEIVSQATAEGRERSSKLASILAPLIDLHNFDQKSMEFLSKNNEQMRNAFKNYRWVEDGIPLRRAKNFCKGAPCVVIAAGPSLDAQWPKLREIRNSNEEWVFIVAGRAYKKAMKEGVFPDFVVEVEQFEWDDKIWLFAPEPPSHATLCGPITTCPSVFSAWPSEKLILLDHNTAQLLGLKVGEDSMDGGNSILHHMVGLATWIGCNPVYLAGADLGYGHGDAAATLTHAKGTFHSWGREVLRNEHAFQDPLDVPCNCGGMARSSPAYRNFATFLELQVEKASKADPSLRVYSLAPHGQKVSNIEFVEIERWKADLTSQPSAPALSLPPALAEQSSSLPASVATPFSDTSSTVA